MVALNTTLTLELLAEGLTREVLRNMHNARKAAACEIADRITVYVGSTPQAVAAVAQQYETYIRWSRRWCLATRRRAHAPKRLSLTAEVWCWR